MLSNHFKRIVRIKRSNFKIRKNQKNQVTFRIQSQSSQKRSRPKSSINLFLKRMRKMLRRDKNWPNLSRCKWRENTMMNLMMLLSLIECVLKTNKKKHIIKNLRMRKKSKKRNKHYKKKGQKMKNSKRCTKKTHMIEDKKRMINIMMSQMIKLNRKRRVNLSTIHILSKNKNKVNI